MPRSSRLTIKYQVCAIFRVMIFLSVCLSSAIFGYYAYSSNKNQLSEIDGNSLTHLLYGFAYLTGDGTVTPGLNQYEIDTSITTKFNCKCGDACLDGVYGEIFQFKTKYPHVKTLISIGGWTWSTYFSQVFASPVLRRNFVESATTFMIKYGFDGIDVDYEFPEFKDREPGFTYSANDFQNMLTFCKELKAYWASKSIDGLLTLAMQAAGKPKFNALVDKFDLYVDYYLVMNYEYHHASKVARHHSNLNYLSTDSVDMKSSIVSGMDKYEWKDTAKVILGIPAYSNVFHVTGIRKNMDNIKGLGSVGTKDPNLHYIYKDIREQDLMVEWDQKRGACSYFDEVNMNFHGFDCVNSVKQKAAYVKSNKLGGMFIWEIGQDSLYKYSLLKTMSNELTLTHTPRKTCIEKTDYCNLKCQK